jgi:1-acyl-sn-glycerol-3-phosphate acyltransferase
MPGPNPFVLPLQLAETFRICTPTVVETALGRVERNTCTRRLDEWARRAMSLAEAELVTHGLEHVDRGRTHLLMSNHQSMYDIFALFCAFPGHMRMVAKKETFVLPIMGKAMVAAEFIPIDRKNHRRAREALDYAHAKIASGINVWIAPEGTRSQSGAMLPFKKGGFMLALHTGVPILPVSIVGTRNILPSKDWRVRKGKRADVHFHAPIDPNDYGLSKRADLIADVRAVIDSALPDYEAEDR